MVERDPLVEALIHKKIVTLEYTKATTGEIVSHTGGIYEIGTNKKGDNCLWLWDTNSNDTIRQFLLSNIESYQILDADFMPPNPWPLKLDGSEIGY